MSTFARVDGDNRVYITDGISRRKVGDELERAALAAIGVVPSAKVQFLSRAIMDRIPILDDALDPGV